MVLNLPLYHGEPLSRMMLGTMKALACVAWALSLINVMAADYVVGNPAGGWDGRTDYKSWAAAQTFAPGDSLSKCHQYTWPCSTRHDTKHGKKAQHEPGTAR